MKKKIWNYNSFGINHNNLNNLLINKQSYSIISGTNYCPEEVIVTKSEDTIELVEGIPLPKSLEVKTLNGDTLDNTALTYIEIVI